MKKYIGITDHVITDWSNQSKSKKKCADEIYGDNPITISIRVDPIIYGRFKAYCTKEGSSKRELASEAIAYWILFLSKEAKAEGIEQVRADWEDIRMKRILNRKTTKKERLIMSRHSWTLRCPGKPWPGVKIAATSQKGDVQSEMNL